MIVLIAFLIPTINVLCVSVLAVYGIVSFYPRPADGQ
jgi:hypothetical protein|tara:strand:- start:224 stop:334 length:111 start_codon:yes stop_codon:yes gene_type:complete